MAVAKDWKSCTCSVRLEQRHHGCGAHVRREQQRAGAPRRARGGEPGRCRHDLPHPLDVTVSNGGHQIGAGRHLVLPGFGGPHRHPCRGGPAVLFS